MRRTREAFAGQHAADSTSFYVFDEASAISEKIFEVAEGGLTDGEPMIFLFGNPTRSSGMLHQVCFGAKRARWDAVVVDSRTSAFTNQTQIQEWIEDYGEDSDFVRVRVRGLPPAASDLQFIDQQAVFAAQQRASEPPGGRSAGLRARRGAWGERYQRLPVPPGPGRPFDCADSDSQRTDARFDAPGGFGTKEALMAKFDQLAELRNGIRDRHRWQCASCRHQVSLTSGTVLHNAKLPLTQWFWAAYLMTTDTRGISAVGLQRQLGLRRNETAWLMLHKLRRAMVNAAREPLHGTIEVDDTWIGGPQPGLRGSRQLKGRRAALVLVAVEKRGRGTGRVRMGVIRDFKATTVTGFLKQHVAAGSTLYTDGLKSFTGLEAAGFRHVARTQPLRRDLNRGVASVVPLARPGHWQPPAVADWYLPWRQPSPTARLPRRVRLSSQSPAPAHGSVSNLARPRHCAPAHAGPPDPRSPRPPTMSNHLQTTTYSG